MLEAAHQPGSAGVAGFDHLNPALLVNLARALELTGDTDRAAFLYCRAWEVGASWVYLDQWTDFLLRHDQLELATHLLRQGREAGWPLAEKRLAALELPALHEK